MSTKMEAARFVSACLEARTHAHKLHLLTTSYARHKALQTFYEDIVDMTDAFAEAYMGVHGKFMGIPDTKLETPTDPQDFIKAFMAYVTTARGRFAESPALQALIDDVITLTAATAYKLATLK